MVRFKLDSGSGTNLLPLHAYLSLFPQKKLSELAKTVDKRVRLVAANRTVIKQLGMVRLIVQVGNKRKVCLFYVVGNNCKPLFGLPDLKAMHLLQFTCPTHNSWTGKSQYPVDSVSSNPRLPKLTKDVVLTQYKDVFSGLGRLKVDPVKITLKEGAIPVQKPCRRIPVKLRDKFKEEVESLVSKGVLTKLHENEATEWLNSFVTVTKENGSLRLCLDPTDLNQHIVRPVCPSYTLDEISYKLRNAKVFSVVDATKGFFQVPLSEESKLLTAMLTPLGVYVYNVLAMGLSLASDVFEQIIRKIISDLPGVINIADDLLIFGQDDKDHDECFIRLLDRCREVGLTLNPAKFKFKCRSVSILWKCCGS